MGTRARCSPLELLRTTLCVGEDVTGAGEREAGSQGNINGEVGVTVDEVLAVEPSDGVPEELVLVAALGLELGDPDRLASQVVHVLYVRCEGVDIGRAIPVSGDVVDSAAAAGSQELLHGSDTGVAVSGRDDDDVGVSIGNGLDLGHVSGHRAGNVHAGTTAALAVLSQQLFRWRREIKSQFIPADVRLVDAQNVLGTSGQSTLNVTVESVHEHLTTVVQHRDEFNTRNHAEARGVLGTSLPVISPGNLARTSEHVRLVLGVLGECKTTLATTLAPLDSRGSARERNKASQGRNESGLKHIEKSVLERMDDKDVKKG